MRIKFLIAACLPMLWVAAAHASHDPKDFDGVWWTRSFEPVFMPADGKPIPFTASGLLAYRQSIADVKQGKRIDLASTRCLPEGLPRVLAAPYPFEIMQRKEIMAFVFEIAHASQLVYMDRPQSDFDDVNEGFMGHSVGHWEGNTLVIDTIGLKTGWLDGTGMPHGEKLHVVERLHKTDAGRQLEALITIEDPEMFERAWTTHRVYTRRADVQLMDYVCGEPNRDVSSVPGVKRNPP